MDLWIKNQTKDEIVKCSKIKIGESYTTKDGVTTTDYTIYNFGNNHIDYLGKYATKERATKIFDEIYELLLTRQCINGYYYNSVNLIYEMPEG